MPQGWEQTIDGRMHSKIVVVSCHSDFVEKLLGLVLDNGFLVDC